MSVQTGRRVMPQRGVYAGRKSSAKRLKQQSDRKLKANTIKLLVCLSVFLLLLAVKFIFPAGAEAVSKHITNGLDYKAAFSALGKAITSGENLAEVFKGISLGAFQKDADGAEVSEPPAAVSPSAKPESDGSTSSGVEGAEAVEAISTIDILDESDLPSDTDDSADNAEGAEGAEGQGGAETLENDPYFEELLLRLPTDELEEDDIEEDELPEHVTNDFYVIDFAYVTPIKGNLTSTFGYRNHPITGKRSFHYGVDIGGKSGDQIAAFSSGTVELTGYNSVYGNYLFLRHKDGIRTFYGHCSKILVEEGQLVLMGETVAKVGTTGLSTGPHLHFEIRNGDMILDPLHYVSPES